MATIPSGPQKKPGTTRLSDDGAAAVQISWRLAEWFADLSKDQLNKMTQFHQGLIQANRSGDLIPQRTIPSADLVHFADCIMACRIINRSIGSADLYDLGSGCGFPGLIYGLLYPASMVFLVESDSRKCDFIREMSNRLSMKNVTVINQNVESLPPESVVFGVSRGFSNIAKSILLARRVFKVGGVYFHMKSEEWSSEISQIPTQLCSIWQPGVLSDYRLPTVDARYFIIKTDKLIK